MIFTERMDIYSICTCKNTYLNACVCLHTYTCTEILWGFAISQAFNEYARQTFSIIRQFAFFMHVFKRILFCLSFQAHGNRTGHKASFYDGILCFSIVMILRKKYKYSFGVNFNAWFIIIFTYLWPIKSL